MKSMKAPSGAEGAPNGGYLAPAGPAEAEIRERGSRFLALMVPVDDEAAATAVLDEIRKQHHGATHHCWASRLGAVKRLSEAPGRRLESESYGEAVEMVIEVERSALEEVEAALADLGPRLEVMRLPVEG